MVISVMGQVFKNVRYTILAIVIVGIMLSAVLLSPNQVAISSVLNSATVSLSSKILFLVDIYGSLLTNFTLVTGLYLILVSILFSINISLLIYYIRRRLSGDGCKSIHVTTFGGFISSILGVGCAACGSIIFTTLLGTSSSGLLIYLPFHGFEFGFLGFSLLILSTYYIIKKINDPLVCPID